MHDLSDYHITENIFMNILNKDYGQFCTLYEQGIKENYHKFKNPNVAVNYAKGNGKYLS